MSEALVKIAGPDIGLALHDTSQGGLGIPMPFESKITLYEDIVIAGTTHVEGIDDIVSKMNFPLDIELVRDVGNLHDAWAIQARYKGAKIGYIPCDVNEVLARLMDGGKKMTCTITEHEKYGHWNRLHAEVILID